MARSSKVPDYDKDGFITSADKELQSWDKDKDGTVSPAEEKAATTAKAGTQVTTTDAKGNSTTKTVGARAAKTKPKSARDYGFTAPMAEKYPDLLPLLQKAIDEEWDDKKWLDEVDMSTFGQARTRAQEAFDLNMADPRKTMDMKKQVDDAYKQFKADAEARGVTLSDAELRNYATESIRSGLTPTDALQFLAGRFRIGAEPAVGEAGSIMTDLQDIARSYGLSMEQTDLQSKVQEGLRQGANYGTWLEGQKNVYKRQAKNLYPTLSDQLDEFTYTDVIEPYMADAANLLGLNRQQMNTLDPMWATALNGPNGPMSRDEWIRTIRTDSKFGYDRTVNARQEAAQLGDQLLAAFGMA